MISIVDERISEKMKRRLQFFSTVIALPRSSDLGEAVCSHPDILMLAHENRIITSADYCEKFPWVFSDIREYSSCEFTVTSDKFGKKYPTDAIFNALIINNYIFYKEDSVASAVKEYAKAKGLTPISVNQGYPACTTLAFKNSAITADRGMAKALSSVGIKVTLIGNGDILLPPHEYGFIGGASGVYKDTVYFLGDITRHRDFALIEKAIKDEGLSYVSLSDEPLCDLGRILFID